MGGARETALASSTYAPYMRRLLIFAGWYWKCHVIIVIKPICRGLLSQCTQACANSTSNPSGYALGIWLPVSHAPSCIGPTNPSRAGLNPLNITFFTVAISWQCRSQCYMCNISSYWLTCSRHLWKLIPLNQESSWRRCRHWWHHRLS